MSENFFKDTLQHHLNQTRAGVYGQFEHSFNFTQGVDQDATYKIGPGENIVFEGALLDGSPCLITVTNNITGPSGAGFAGQQVIPPDDTVIVPVDPQPGNVTIEFECQTDPVTYITSYAGYGGSFNRWRWGALADNDDLLLDKRSSSTSGAARDIVCSATNGDWYICGQPGNLPPDAGSDAQVAKYDANGNFVWRAEDDDAFPRLLAYDPVNDVLVVWAAKGAGQYLVGYDGSGGNQGGLGEPAPLWETFISPTSTFIDLVANGAGFAYVTMRGNDQYDGATPGTFHNVLKVDCSDGSVVAGSNTKANVYEVSTNSRCLAVDSAGNLILVQNTSDTPASGGAACNVLKFDSSLNIAARANIAWQSKMIAEGYSGTASVPNSLRMSVAVDENDDVYAITGNSYSVKLDSTLATELFSKELDSRGPGSTNRAVTFAIVGAGHNLSNALVLFGSSGVFGTGFTVPTIVRLDNAGVYQSEVVAPSLIRFTLGCGGQHVTPAITPLASGPNRGTQLASELSQTPPGRYPAVAAVKFASQEVTDVYFNTTEIEFDPTSWVATHSVRGVIPANQWEYHSPL